MAPLQGFRLRSPRCSLAPHAVRVVWLALGVWTFATLPALARADATQGEWIQGGQPGSVTNSMLPVSADYVLVYDSLRDRLVAFGAGSYPRNTTWTLSMAPGSNWVKLSPHGNLPSDRRVPSGIYDPVGDRIIIFGGEATDNGVFYNDVWQLSLSGNAHWTQLSPTGTPPPPRWSAAAIYDPIGQRLVLFGGDAGNGYLDGVWTLSLTGTPAWAQLTPSGIPPAGRSFMTYAYNPDHGSLIVFGGQNGGGMLNDTWELTLSGSPAWSQIAAPSPPSPRRDGVGIYDPAAHRFIISCGAPGLPPYATNETWQLDMSSSPAWSQIGVPIGWPPPAREAARGCFDPVRRQMVLVAGSIGFVRHSDTWSLALSGPPAWTQLLHDQMPLAGGRSDNALALRPDTQELYSFGGTTESGDINELRRLNVSSPTSLSELIVPAGVPPSPRHGHRAIWDPVRTRMLMLGGSDGAPRNDLWSFAPDPPTWMPVATSGTPPTARSYFGLGYDPVRDRLILVGGSSGASYLNDAWALPLSGPSTLVWAQLTVSGTPPAARTIYGMQYDPVRDRLMFVGGLTASGRDHQAWALNLSGSPSWTQLLPGGGTPDDRSEHAMVYDPYLDRMMMFGGFNGTTYVGDIWSLSLGGSPIWSQLSPAGEPPTRRGQMSAVFDPTGRQMVELGGWDGGIYVNDTWALNWATLVDVPPAGAADAQFALEGARPNPAVGHRVTVSFVLPDAAPARLDLLDITGRRVATRDLAGLGAGRHQVAFEPEHALQPGVYLVKLTGAGGMRTAKVCVMQ